MKYHLTAVLLNQPMNKRVTAEKQSATEKQSL